MVSDLGHPMISREDENRFFVPVELRNETFGSFHDVIYDLDVFHILLTNPENGVSFMSKTVWERFSLVNVVDVSDQ